MEERFNILFNVCKQTEFLMLIACNLKCFFLSVPGPQSSDLIVGAQPFTLVHWPPFYLLLLLLLLLIVLFALPRTSGLHHLINRTEPEVTNERTNCTRKLTVQSQINCPWGDFIFYPKMAGSKHDSKLFRKFFDNF